MQNIIDWGMDMICNKTLDITKKMSRNKRSLNNSIDEFIFSCTSKKNGSHLYQEELYAAYTKFYAIKAPGEKLISKGAFTKYVKNMDGITYSRYNIRKSSKCDTPSNRYAFKNLAIDEEKLNLFLTKKQIVLDKYSKEFDCALEQITEHYADLFTAVIDDAIKNQKPSSQAPDPNRQKVAYTISNDK